MSTEQQPIFVPYRDTRRRLWGDRQSGILSDWFFARTLRVNVNIFSIPAGSFARDSPNNPSIFGADEVFYVLQGVMIVSNPETGEMYRVNEGEASFFRKDTYNHAFNHGTTALRALEFFHPTPDSGAGRNYGTSKPKLTVAKYGRDDLVGQWPMAAARAAEEASMWVIGEGDYLWRYEGETSGLLTGLIVSTEHATIGKHYFSGGQRTDELSYPGDKVLFVEKGSLHVEFPDTRDWFELGPWDGFFIPEGRPHRYYNESGEETQALFVVAPDYLKTTRES
jgi:quercetin dioxygenase-like cupin family protein